MKTLYLDCGMGAAGDMLTGALLELLPDADGFLAKLNALGIPDVEIKKEPSVKCGITGTHISVTVDGREEESCDHHHEHSHEHHHEHSRAHEHDHHTHDHPHACGERHEHGDCHAHHQTHSHRGMLEIEHLVREHLPLPEKVKEDILAVYGQIAAAESHVHGVSVEQIHFHEVGAMDALADITAVCLLMDELSADEVVVSPIHVGSGQVKCAHGILPVPAPATAEILKDIPIYGGSIQGELCTPTGAALLKHFATRFGNMPVMQLQAVGYGMGKKDFAAANCVRAMLGETENREDVVLELSCNVDDMTAEEIGFAMERLFAGGALEVYTIPIQMKKSRPGTLLRVMCREEERETMVQLLFRHTTTLGIRQLESRRYVLERAITKEETPYGAVSRKDASGYGVTRSKYEYEDIARIAREKGLSLKEVREMLEKDFF